jgi:hypothetical protein
MKRENVITLGGNMTIQKISASQYISGKLRYGVHNGDLTDYNSGNRASTFGNWIYPDRPRITDLLKNKNNFPRVSIESMDQSTIRRMGMRSTAHHDLVQLAINTYSPPNLTCEVANTATEDHTYVTGTDVYALDNIPVSIIGATIDGTKAAGAWSFDRGTDYELIDNDYDGLYDSVSWLGADEPDNGTTFTCAYNRKASGEELCRIIAQDVNKYIRENWMSWFEADKELTYYKVVSSRPVALDDYQNINRYEIFCTFSGINLGETR